MNIYVGNMSFELTEQELREAFEAYGEVESINIITDRDTGRPRGFGFVEMPDEEAAMAAIEGLHEKELKGRNLNVNKAKPRTERRGGGGGGGGGGGRGRGGGGGGGFGGGGGGRRW